MADRIWKEEDVRPSRKLDENARPSLLQQAHRSGSPPLPTTCQGSAGAPAIRQQKNELPFDRHRRRLGTTPDANSKFFFVIYPLFAQLLENRLSTRSHYQGANSRHVVENSYVATIFRKFVHLLLGRSNL